MSEIKDGGPAFPRTGEGFGNPKYDAPGMTLRDHFAIHAEVDGFAFQTIEQACAAMGVPEPDEFDLVAMMKFGAACQAHIRYMIADAMLAARKGGSP